MDAAARERVKRMNRANPKYVLRNYLAQQAIDALEGGDASFMERLMAVLERPYDEQPEHDELAARRARVTRLRPIVVPGNAEGRSHVTRRIGDAFERRARRRVFPNPALAVKRERRDDSCC